MAYTVKQLAKLSGVSVRTLHWYHKIELLCPAYHGENSYRYYEDEQLLRLQQILFFKELGFSLTDIQGLLSQDDFDQLEALKLHKKTLEARIDQQKQLIDTIDKTILHLEGKEEMMLETIFDGFTKEKQQLYENYLQERGVEQNILEQSKKKTKNWSKEDWLRYKEAADQVHRDLIKAIEENRSSASPEVQEIIQRHYEQTCYFWTPDRSGFDSLSELYGAHPDFVRFYQDLHPELLSFLQSAMKVYAI